LELGGSGRSPVFVSMPGSFRYGPAVLVHCTVSVMVMAGVATMRVRVIVLSSVDVAVFFHGHRLLSVRLLPDALA
jgi:hypothetical protein